MTHCRFCRTTTWIFTLCSGIFRIWRKSGKMRLEFLSKSQVSKDCQEGNRLCVLRLAELLGTKVKPKYRNSIFAWGLFSRFLFWCFWIFTSGIFNSYGTNDKNDYVAYCTQLNRIMFILYVNEVCVWFEQPLTIRAIVILIRINAISCIEKFWHYFYNYFGHCVHKKDWSMVEIFFR